MSGVNCSCCLLMVFFPGPSTRPAPTAHSQHRHACGEPVRCGRCQRCLPQCRGQTICFGQFVHFFLKNGALRCEQHRGGSVMLEVMPGLLPEIFMRFLGGGGHLGSRPLIVSANLATPKRLGISSFWVWKTESTCICGPPKPSQSLQGGGKTKRLEGLRPLPI